MSVSSSAVEAYRDSTKWLASFLPITALATGGVVLGPPLLQSVSAATGPWEWLRHTWIVVVAVLVLVGSIAAVLHAGAAVLSAEGPSLTEISRRPEADTAAGPHRTALAEAIGRGLTLPHYFTIEEFQEDLSRLNLLPMGDRGGDPDTTRSLPAMEMIRDWPCCRR